MKIAAPIGAAAPPAAPRGAKATAPATPAGPAPAALAGDRLRRSAPKPPQPASGPMVRPPETWIGIASSGVAVGLAAFGLASLTGAWLPILGAAAALEGVLVLCGLGLTRGWGEPATPRPYDKTKWDWSPMAIMTRAAGAIGFAGTLVATALGTSAVAMTAGPVAVFAWPAAVIATGLVGVLAWATLKERNPLGRR